MKLHMYGEVDPRKVEADRAAVRGGRPAGGGGEIVPTLVRNRRFLRRADSPERRPDGQLNGQFCEHVVSPPRNDRFLWPEPPGLTPPQVTRARRTDPPGDHFLARKKCCKN